MKFEKGMVIKAFLGNEYVIMSVLTEGEKEYAFANKFEGEEPTDEYSIFTILDGEVEMVEDEEIMRRLQPIFLEKIDADLVELLEKEGDK